MKKKIPLALTLCSAALSLSAHAQAPQQWKAIAFGQSTDLNFSSNVLPEKVGVNNVTIDGKTLTSEQIASLSKPITIESRGGKIANSHDGLTFFYTALPSDENFVLSATVTVDQFGPENGAKPAAQEGAGLLVRDIIGIPRQEPLKEGYEEFPAASNMVMNAIMTQDKKDDYRVKLQAISRNGITQPWGNAGSEIKKVSYKEGVDLRESPAFRLKLERTNEGFITAWAPVGSEEWITQQVPNADLISVQDKKQYYVGFFASRNAKITVSDASLTTSAAQTVASKPFIAKSWPVVMQVASGSQSAGPNYSLQARANYDGLFSVRQNEVVIGENKPVKAGEMFTLPTTLKDNNSFQITFTPTSGSDRSPVEQELTVSQHKAAANSTLYAAANGKTDAKGTAEAPLDLTPPSRLYHRAVKWCWQQATMQKRISHSPQADLRMDVKRWKPTVKRLSTACCWTVTTGRFVVSISPTRACVFREAITLSKTSRPITTTIPGFRSHPPIRSVARCGQAITAW